MRVHFCPSHSKKKSWLFCVSNIHSLSTIMHGVRTHWTTEANWQRHRNYLDAMMGERVLEDERRMMKRALKRARAALGAEAIDGDGTVVENINGNDDDDSEDSDDYDASMPPPPPQKLVRRASSSLTAMC